MERCETCTHWDQRPGEKRFCSVLSNLDDADQLAVYAGTFGNLLDEFGVDAVFTPRNFGCVYHVPQE